MRRPWSQCGRTDGDSSFGVPNQRELAHRRRGLRLSIIEPALSADERRPAASKILALRQNDEVANRDMRRPGEHEEKRVNDVVVAQAAMRGDPTLDLFRIGQAPKLV